MATNSQVLKFVGSTGWFEMNDAERVAVNQAIFDGANTLLLECEYERQRYSLKLERVSGDEFNGGCTVRSGREEWPVIVNCKFITTAEGAIVFGTWKEYGVGYYWWAELEQVERFDHEGQSKV